MTGPVYTTENECQDCYKCVRHCPVKAIRIVGGKASVIPEACVACGECVKVCPAHAKKIRNDLARLRQLLESPARVYAWSRRASPPTSRAFPSDGSRRRCGRSASRASPKRRTAPRA